jgi:prepilin peptidase CpaA
MFASLMIVAAWSDAIDYKIPNRLIVALLVLYPAFVLTAGRAIDWPLDIAVAVGILAVGLFLYGTGKFGAGDVKLIAATSLWAGTEHTLHFILLTGTAGGVVALAYIVRMNFGWVVGQPTPSDKTKILPYGIAIAAGGLFVSAKLIINAHAV